MVELTSEEVALLTQKLSITEESVMKQHAAYLGVSLKIKRDHSRIISRSRYKTNTRLGR